MLVACFLSRRASSGGWVRHLSSEGAGSIPLIRLAKLMANRRLCSRMEAERLIKDSLVLIDGQPVSWPAPMLPADAGCRIQLLPQATASLSNQLTILLHKPPGVVSSQPAPDMIPAVCLFFSLRSPNSGQNTSY